MIHFFEHLNWSVIIFFGLWLSLACCPKIAKNTLLGSCAFLSLIAVAILLGVGAGTPIAKYTSRYFVIDVQKKNSGYKIIVNKKYYGLKAAKSIWYNPN